MNDNFFDSITSYMETVLKPDEIIIAWNKTLNLFIIYNSTATFPSHRLKILNPIEFFDKYRYYIKPSKYYNNYMAYILGQHG